MKSLFVTAVAVVLSIVGLATSGPAYAYTVIADCYASVYGHTGQLPHNNSICQMSWAPGGDPNVTHGRWEVALWVLPSYTQADYYARPTFTLSGSGSEFTWIHCASAEAQLKMVFNVYPQKLQIVGGQPRWVDQIGPGDIEYATIFSPLLPC